MPSVIGGLGPFPATTIRPLEDNQRTSTESANEGDAIIHPKPDQSDGISDNATPQHGVSKEHLKSQSPSPAQAPPQNLQHQLDKARFEKKLAIIQARAQHSPLAKLPKLRLPEQTPTEAATFTGRRRSRNKQEEVVLPQPNIRVPKEERSVIESLGIVCYFIRALDGKRSDGSDSTGGCWFGLVGGGGSLGGVFRANNYDVYSYDINTEPNPSASSPWPGLQLSGCNSIHSHTQLKMSSITLPIHQ
ncbi:hypothetical protein HOY82DRAFT_543183 [Tuber indicum]|nr:hypothetical protein HOY82DRAFT_543183 [Tuber indicum]